MSLFSNWHAHQNQTIITSQETKASPLNAADNDMIENMRAHLIANNISDPQFMKIVNNIRTGKGPTGRSYTEIMSVKHNNTSLSIQFTL